MKAAELRKLTEAQLQEELARKRAELVEAKRSHAAGDLANPRVLTIKRREIALLLTVMAEQRAESKKEEKNNG